MKFQLDNGRVVDAATLSSEERHILQKWLAWQSLVTSVAQFREKRKQALEAGWNGSGPVRESPLLADLGRHLEEKLRARLKSNGSG